MQVTDKHKVFGLLMSGDLDGIIINPGTDECFVPRQVILRLLNGSLFDDELGNASRYAFPVK